MVNLFWGKRDRVISLMQKHHLHAVYSWILQNFQKSKITIWYWECSGNIAICRSIQCLKCKQLDSSSLCSIEHKQWHHWWWLLSTPCCWKQLWRIVTVKEVLGMCYYVGGIFTRQFPCSWIIAKCSISY